MSLQSQFLGLVLVCLSPWVSSMPPFQDPHGMTWMGWLPGGGMTAIATSGGYEGMEDFWPAEFPPRRTTSTPQLRPTLPEGSKEQPTEANVPVAEQQESEEEAPVKGKATASNPGSNAHASFNAWFPIYLGMASPELSRRHHEDGDKDLKLVPGARRTPDHWRSAPTSDRVSVTANSVNHGARGVASSHAFSFGAEPPLFARFIPKRY